MDFKSLLNWVGALVFVLIFFVFAAIWVGFHRGEQSQFQQGSGQLCGNVPEPYKTIFEKAAAEYHAPAALIAAIFSCGEHGSSWPKDSNGPWATNPDTGASGPFQFMPCTWSKTSACPEKWTNDQRNITPSDDPILIASQGGYGKDCDGDGKADIQNIKDASCAASDYLKKNIDSQSGTEDEKIKKAIYLYNHSSAYVDTVFACCQKFSCKSIIEKIGDFIQAIVNYVTRPFMDPPGPTSIVLHWSGGSTLAGLESAMGTRDCGGGSKCICQLGIDTDGQTYQFMRSLEEKPVCQNEWNEHGIGIEIVGTGKTDLMNNQTQFNGVVATVRILMQKYNIPAINDPANARGILGHYQINPQKSDPSEEYLFKVINAVK